MVTSHPPLMNPSPLPATIPTSFQTLPTQHLTWLLHIPIIIVSPSLALLTQDELVLRTFSLLHPYSRYRPSVPILFIRNPTNTIPIKPQCCDPLRLTLSSFYLLDTRNLLYLS